MMNRERALKWLVDNFKEWPETIPYQFEGMLIDEWKFLFVNREVKFFNIPGTHDCLTKQDWQAAQPAPATNKPSWDDAPEDAKILVQNEDGKFFFSSYKIAFPAKTGGAWIGEGNGQWFDSLSGYAPNPNWRDTLEYRPKVKDYSVIKNMSEEEKESASAFADEVLYKDMALKEKEDSELQYVPTNLIRIKQLHEEIELAQLSIEEIKIELAERNKEVSDVLNYYKFNA